MPVERSNNDLFSTLFPTSHAAPVSATEESSGSSSVFAQQLTGATLIPTAGVGAGTGAAGEPATGVTPAFTFGQTNQTGAEGDSAQDPAALLQTLLATLARLGAGEEGANSANPPTPGTSGSAVNPDGTADSNLTSATSTAESAVDQEAEKTSSETENILFSSLSALLATVLAATPQPSGQNGNSGTTTSDSNSSAGLAIRSNDPAGGTATTLLANTTVGTAAEGNTTGTAITTGGATGSGLTGAPLRLRQQLFGQTSVETAEPTVPTDNVDGFHVRGPSAGGGAISGTTTAQTSNPAVTTVGTTTPVLSNQFASVSQTFATAATSGSAATTGLLAPSATPLEVSGTPPSNGTGVKQEVSQPDVVGAAFPGANSGPTDSLNLTGANQTQASAGALGSGGSTVNGNPAALAGNVTTTGRATTTGEAITTATPTVTSRSTSGSNSNVTTLPEPVVSLPDQAAAANGVDVANSDGSTTTAESVGTAAVATINSAAVEASAAQAAVATGLAESIAQTAEESTGSRSTTDQTAQRNRALGLVTGTEHGASVVTTATRTELAPSIANRLSERLGRLAQTSQETRTSLAGGNAGEERVSSEVWSAGANAGASGISLKFAAALSNTASSSAATGTANPANVPLSTLDPVAGGIGQAMDSGEGLSIILTPPDLGLLRIEVRTGAGGVEARLETSTDHATRLLSDHLPWLQDALQQRGTTVDRIEIQQVNPERWSTGERAFAETGGQSFQDSRRQSQSQTPQPELLPPIDVSTSNDLSEPRPAGPPRRWDRINLHV